MKIKLTDEILAKIEFADKYISEEVTKDNSEIAKAMAYSVLAGGKRIRPLLAILACEALGGKAEVVIPMAAAIEAVHCYSLIHDDLPAMDDDDFRRGKPSNHKVFGEAMAILAGDALLTEAFSLICKAEIPDTQKVKATEILARRAGKDGMVLGQALDMKGTDNLESLLEIYRRKTSDLLCAALSMGALAAGGSGHEFDEFGEKIGIAFQIKDDILDVLSTEEVLGKPICSDEKNAKKTSLKFISLDEAQKMVSSLSEEGKNSIEFTGKAGDNLRLLADYLIFREY